MNQQGSGENGQGHSDSKYKLSSQAEIKTDHDLHKIFGQAGEKIIGLVLGVLTSLILLLLVLSAFHVFDAFK